MLPMSIESYKKSFKCQMDVSLAEGYDELIFVPGNIGEKLALKLLDVEDDEVVQMSNFVGYMDAPLRRLHDDLVRMNTDHRAFLLEDVLAWKSLGPLATQASEALEFNMPF